MSLIKTILFCLFFICSWQMSFAQSSTNKDKKDCVDCEGQLTSTVKPDISVAKELDKNLDKVTGLTASHTDSSNMTLASEKKENLSQYSKEELKKIICSMLCKGSIDALMDIYNATKDQKVITFEYIMNNVQCSTHYLLLPIRFSPLIYFIENFIVSPLNYLYSRYELRKEEEKFIKIMQYSTPEAGSALDVLLHYHPVKLKNLKNESFLKGYYNTIEFLCDYEVEFVKNKNMTCDKILGEIDGYIKKL